MSIFIDERTVSYQDTYDSFVWENLTRYLTESWAQAGAGYRVFLLADYRKWQQSAAASETKLEVFLNGWLHNASEWEAMIASPRAQLWLYGANLVADSGYHSVPPTTPLLGYDLREAGPLTIESSTLTPTTDFTTGLPAWGNHPYDPVVHAGQKQLFGESLAEHYVPAIRARGVVPYRTLATFANGTPGLTERWVNGNRRLFCSLPYLTADALRALYRRIGISLPIPYGDWWVETGRDAISVNTKAAVSNPQVLADWLATQDVLLAPSDGTIRPGVSYIVRE